MFQQTPREEISNKSRSTKNSGLTQRKEKSDRFFRIIFLKKISNGCSKRALSFVGE